MALFVVDADRALLSAWEYSSAQLAEVSLRAAEALYMGSQTSPRVAATSSMGAKSEHSVVGQACLVEVLSPSGVWRRCTILRTVRPPEEPEEAIVVRYEGFSAEYDESIAAGEWPDRLRIPVPQ